MYFDWIEFLLKTLLVISIFISFTLRFFREQRYQKDDDQYIP